MLEKLLKRCVHGFKEREDLSCELNVIALQSCQCPAYVHRVRVIGSKSYERIPQ